ncbi:mitochondrial 18 kDa protein, putative [Pediculus humanus corporis]|uniref:Mitochondrial fission process protein 1 n=1 Tax=Pediculus humanus subsp. corporis TaxID=121224 RepID=E0VQC5_PEDHC|nr:mitochondrial 18 kDa protein, putative [Pediculus humanus corporis]EEB15581.1 mitochondrial 18 kDa protein, putative [Pediculus humanus corporis]
MSGYANEVGESFRSLIHVYWVRASYGVASLYVLADTADKTIKAHNIEKGNKEYNKYKVVMTTVDTITWQGLASVIIPGLTINRICAATFFSLSKLTKFSSATRKWTTTAVGLGCIPFIVTPIDTFVDFLLNKTLRPLFR